MQVKIVVEQHEDGFVAYPLGLKGTVVGQGDTYETALADVKSAIKFHIETFGPEVLPGDTRVLQAYLAEATIPAWEWGNFRSKRPRKRSWPPFACSDFK